MGPFSTSMIVSKKHIQTPKLKFNYTPEKLNECSLKRKFMPNRNTSSKPLIFVTHAWFGLGVDMDRGNPRRVSMWSSELILSFNPQTPSLSHQTPKWNQTKEPNQTNQTNPPKWFTETRLPKKRFTKIHGRYKTPGHSSITFPKELNLSFIRCSWSPGNLKDIPPAEAFAVPGWTRVDLFWRWNNGGEETKGEDHVLCM